MNVDAETQTLKTTSAVQRLRIPKSWLNFSPVGSRIPNTPFVVSKAPLSSDYTKHLPERAQLLPVKTSATGGIAEPSPRRSCNQFVSKWKQSLRSYGI